MWLNSRWNKNICPLNPVLSVMLTERTCLSDEAEASDNEKIWIICGENNSFTDSELVLFIRTLNKNAHFANGILFFCTSVIENGVWFHDKWLSSEIQFSFRSWAKTNAERLKSKHICKRKYITITLNLFCRKRPSRLLKWSFMPVKWVQFQIYLLL